MTHDQLVDLISRRGRGRFDDPTATARAVRQTLRTSYPINPQMDEMVTAALAASWDHIRYLKRSMKRLDRLIARYIDLVPNPIISIKGLGAVITAGILAEIIDVLRFPEEKHLAQFMGLTWRKSSSAGFVSQNTRLTKIGNVYLRYYFVLGANLLRQHNLEYKAYYWRKHQEVSKYQHKRALVLTARKLVRLVHALLTRNETYVRPRTTDRVQEDAVLQ
jgi:transposase